MLSLRPYHLLLHIPPSVHLCLPPALFPFLTPSFPLSLSLAPFLPPFLIILSTLLPRGLTLACSQKSSLFPETAFQKLKVNKLSVTKTFSFVGLIDKLPRLRILPFFSSLGLGKLTNLRRLHLDHNNLTSLESIVLEHLTNLEYLSAENNCISSIQGLKVTFSILCCVVNVKILNTNVVLSGLVQGERLKTRFYKLLLCFLSEMPCSP